MKRLRDDSLEYLGGDLPVEDKGLTKAQRNTLRKQNNRQWKFVDRKVGSGIDPSPRHTIYYKTQLPELCDKQEWESFQQSLIDPLPVTFRLGGLCPSIVKQSLISRFDSEFKRMKDRFIQIDGKVVTNNIVSRIGWIKDDVWQVCADSVTLAKNHGLEPLSQLLLREVNLGNVVRQELASMIPALLLGVEGHHNVLDVCAAPGSKTEQLLHMLHRNCNSNKNELGYQHSSGMVVANDADPVRISTLKKRYSRCLTPNLLITCATAAELVSCINQPVFDRILADVPCSGDGTIRKFPHIWRLFRPRMALDLHLVQLSIAIDSVKLLKRDNGRMVYSTCSINPIEDEAVVCALLRHYWNEGLRLVNTRGNNDSEECLLPNLKTREGLRNWHCGKETFACGEVNESTYSETLKRLPPIVESMFPPNEEEAEKLHLEYCHRILPHDNDTGGFFIAVLQFFPTLATNKTKKKVKKTENRTSKQEKSVEVMKQLGYNPKRKSDIKNDKRSELNSNVKYSLLEPFEVKEVCASLQLPSSSAITKSMNTNNSDVDSNSTIHLVCTEQDSHRCYSMVSSNVLQALHTWAGAGSDDTAETPRDVLVHAGVVIAKSTNINRLSSVHPLGDCRIFRDGLSALLPLLQNSAEEPTPLCRLNLADFKILCMLRTKYSSTANTVLNLLVRKYSEDCNSNDSEYNKVITALNAIRGQVSEAGKAELRNSYILTKKHLKTIQRQLREHDVQGKNDIYSHIIIIADESVCISESDQNNTSSSNVSRQQGKRRLSKAQRKKLKNQGSQSVIDSLTISHIRDVADTSSSNTARAAILCSVRASYSDSCDINSSDIELSFSSSEDICQSFYDALSSS